MGLRLNLGDYGEILTAPMMPYMKNLLLTLAKLQIVKMQAPRCSTS